MNARQLQQTQSGRSLALVNPHSGSAAAHGEYLRAFEDNGGRVCATSDDESLAAALVEAGTLGRRRLIIVGGDGSISRVVNALGDDAAGFELAIVPAGTGNDLARSAGIPIEDPVAAWDLAVRGDARPIDVVALRGDAKGYFLNSITGGFGGSQAAQLPSELKSSWGKISYWLSAASQLVEMPEFDLLLKLNGQEHIVRCLGFWFANGRTVGGGFTVAPTALLDDGLLDVVVIPSLPPLELVGASVDFTLGEQENSGRILTFQTDRLVFAAAPQVPLSVDGEPCSASHLECDVLSKMLNLVVGTVDAAVSQEVNPA
jgi:diacylglycerol kinase (ATP)